MVMKFRKKPVTVEAMQWTWTNSDDLREWCGIHEPGEIWETPIFKVEGFYEAFVYDKLHTSYIPLMLGDWVVKGVLGEFYPVKDEVFLETYSVVLDEEDAA